MLFSLIVTTLGRTDELKRLFESLRRQTVQDFEIIVSDQNADDRVAAIVREAGFGDRISHVKSSGGASRGRNAGIDCARGELLGFPDDDCTFPPGVLKTVADFFSAHPEYGLVSGRGMGDDGKDSISRFARHAGEIEKMKVHRQCNEFAIFVRRAALGPLRYDEHMGVGSRSPWHSDEAPDLVLRLQASGVRCYFEPLIAIWHPSPVLNCGPKEIDRAYRYALGTGYFYRKHLYPFRYFAYYAGRTFAGVLVSVGFLRWARARFYLARLRGMWRGWNSTPVRDGTPVAS